MSDARNKVIVAIHQPNFFPWLGYFDKIIKSDLFVFMDAVAYPKSGNSMGSWSNRVRIQVQRSPFWLNCPVVREHGPQIIQDVKLDNKSGWRAQRIKTIEYNYKRAAFFDEVFDFVRSLVMYETDGLADYNISNTLAICDKLGIKCKYVPQSILDTSQSATDLLIEITRKVQGTAYLCGGGAGGYQEDEKFEQGGIELIYQNFQHPIYKQYASADFMTGMSIIDALMNCGFAGTRTMLVR